MTDDNKQLPVEQTAYQKEELKPLVIFSDDDPFREVISPAKTYLITRMNSPQSREIATSILNSMARAILWIKPDAKKLPKELFMHINWSQLTYDRAVAIGERVEVWRSMNKLKPLSTASRNHYLSVVKGVAKEAVRKKMISRDEYEAIKEIPSSRFTRLPKGRALPVAEVSQLMDFCLNQDGLAGIRDAAILGILFGCGPRRSEMAQMTVEDINWSESQIVVRGKGDKHRSLHLPERSAELLKLWLDESGIKMGAIWFQIDRFGRMCPNAISAAAIRNLCLKRASQAGLERTTPHDLRRSFITYLLDNDVGIETAAEMAGHASIETTRIYDRGATKRAKEAAAKVKF